MEGHGPLLVVGGVTAAGKTALAISLCQALGGEVISADSMQVYRDMDIATAAPTPAQRALVPHHLAGFLSPEAEFSVADYAALARREIAALHGRGKLPVVVGGTGLYLSALMDNWQFEGFAGDPGLRRRLEAQWEAEGGAALYERLQSCDPALAAALAPQNKGRVLRALEVYLATGVPMSEHQRRARAAGPCYRVCALALGYQSREEMRRRIGLRVERMVEAGLVEEARRFYSLYPSRTAAAAIGYKELLPYLRGEEPLQAGISRLKLRTAQYAKRQLTWLRRDGRYRWLWVDALGQEGVFPAALQIVRDSGILQNF